MDSPAFAIRAGLEDDRDFILATWLRGYRHGSSFARRIRDGIFYRHHHPIATALLSRSNVLVAHDPEAPAVIYGYLVWEPGAVHWSYVKEDFRRYGIATALLYASSLPKNLKGIEITHGSDSWWAHVQRKYPEAVYNPYRAFGA